MKLIIAIISKDDRGDVTHELISAKYSVTKIPTTGGFLSAGNVTLLVGTEREKVDTAIEIIKKNSRMRKEFVPVTATDGIGIASLPVEVCVGGATIFVVDVERFEKV